MAEEYPNPRLPQEFIDALDEQSQAGLEGDEARLEAATNELRRFLGDVARGEEVETHESSLGRLSDPTPNQQRLWGILLWQSEVWKQPPSPDKDRALDNVNQALIELFQAESDEP